MERTDNRKTAAFHQFESIVGSVLNRTYEISAAQSTFFRLIATYYNFRAQDAEKLCNGSACEKVFENLRLTKDDWVNILETSYAANTIIASISMLDSFRSDLTKVLLIMHPDTLSRERQVKVGDILSCTSISKVFDTVLGKYVHELSYKSLRERIQYLDQAFGIDLSEHAPLVEKLQKHSDLRF